MRLLRIDSLNYLEKEKKMEKKGLVQEMSEEISGDKNLRSELILINQIEDEDEERWEKEINRFLKRNPKYSVGYYSKSFSRYKRGKYKEAIDLLTIAIKLNPDGAIPYNKRGAAYFELGRFEEAIENFSESIELCSDFAEAYYHRGLCYFKEGKFEEALLDLDNAIKHRYHPDFEAYNLRGHILFTLGEREKAIRDFDRSVRNDPDFYSSDRKLDPVYKEISDRFMSTLNMVSYTKIIELIPNYADWAYYKRGRVYSELGKFDEAIEDFSKAIELNPDYVRAHLYRGECYWKQGNFEKSIEDYKKVVQLDSGYPIAWFNLARLYSLKKSKKEVLFN